MWIERIFSIVAIMVCAVGVGILIGILFLTILEVVRRP